MKVILASRSARRKRLLKELGLDFRVVPSNADESRIQAETPVERVKKLAMLKAATVANNMKREHAIIIGADTVVSVNGETMGKPVNRKQYGEMLERLSGREHRVYTGICLINTQTQNVYTDYQKTKVRFRNLTAKDIERCISAGGAVNDAAGYSNDTHPLIIEGIEGSYTNVQGLPTEKLIPLLRENGVDI